MAALAAGLVHPLLAPAHEVALIGIALIAGRHPGRARAAIVAAFAAGLACGLVAIALSAGETLANDVLWAAAGGCGIAAAAGMRLRCGLAATIAATIAFAVGAALGLDSPPETIFLGEAVAMLIGTACGAVAALALVTLFAAALAPLWQGMALRVAGSWIAAIAALVLALRWVG
jgi:urease accessory protein